MDIGMAATDELKTEHLVARRFCSVSRTLDHHTHLRVAQGSRRDESDVWDVFQSSHGLAPTCGQAPGNWCDEMGQSQVLQGLGREDKEIDIWKVCKLSPKGEISMPTLNKKLNWLFKENAQLRKYFRRLRQKWTKEIGNKEMLRLTSMKPIENSNIRDSNQWAEQAQREKFF